MISPTGTSGLGLAAQEKLKVPVNGCNGTPAFAIVYHVTNSPIPPLLSNLQIMVEGVRHIV